MLADEADGRAHRRGRALGVPFHMTAPEGVLPQCLDRMLKGTIKMDDPLRFFKETGFFGETEAAIQHLRDCDEILFAESVDYCVMFGTLLGLIRHDDLIPWDDDLDIIIFDIDRFETRCRRRFEERGYVVYDDVRIIDGAERRCGYRIHSEEGFPIPGQSWKFPWVGVWEPDTSEDMMRLPPETFTYAMTDFFPLRRRAFLDFFVNVPQHAGTILKRYYGSDCLEFCMLHSLDHRNYRPTGFPSTKFALADVLRYLKENP